MSPRPSSAATNGVMIWFVGTLNNPGMAIVLTTSARLYQSSSWSSTGTPRKIQMYAQAVHDATGLADTRIVARMVPSTMPSASHAMASRSVCTRPVSMTDSEKKPGTLP